MCVTGHSEATEGTAEMLITEEVSGTKLDASREFATGESRRSATKGSSL